MKKLILLALAAAAMMLTSCNKGLFSSQIKFDVSDTAGTKAVLNGVGESGMINVTWEEGDFFQFDVEVYPENALPYTLPWNKVEGKLVYEDGSWVIYEAHGSSFTKEDYISVGAPSLNCIVRASFLCTNGDLRTGDPNCFTCSWVQTVPFAEGPQTIQVKLPDFSGHSE